MANGKDSRTVCRRGKMYQKGVGNDPDMMPEIVSAVHVVSEVSVLHLFLLRESSGCHAPALVGGPLFSLGQPN